MLNILSHVPKVEVCKMCLTTACWKRSAHLAVKLSIRSKLLFSFKSIFIKCMFVVAGTGAGTAAAAAATPG